ARSRGAAHPRAAPPRPRRTRPPLPIPGAPCAPRPSRARSRARWRPTPWPGGEACAVIVTDSHSAWHLLCALLARIRTLRRTPTRPPPLAEAPTPLTDALRAPERFVRAWRDHGPRAYPLSLFALLLGVSVAATALYGFVMGLPLGWHAALERSLRFTVAA